MQKGRQKNEVALLSERYVILLLIRMLDSQDSIKLNDLSDTVTSFRTLDALTDRMAAEGVITKKLERRNYVTMFLELTPKGRSVAEKLKEAMDIFQSS
jgi:DNA-binding HxlR family transcriptional regulator